MATEVLTPSPANGQLSPALGPPTEVLPRPGRRTFTAAYKRRILDEADQCTEPGQVGALLRREGLYSSHLVDWRRQRREGQLGRTRRGKPAAGPAVQEVTRLRRENARLQQRLAQAEIIIAVQKKLAASIHARWPLGQREGAGAANYALARAPEGPSGAHRQGGAGGARLEPADRAGPGTAVAADPARSAPKEGCERRYGPRSGIRP